MTALLFDTGDMHNAGTQRIRAAGELLAHAPALAPTGVLMPPALEVEALAAAASVGGDLAASSAFYGPRGADLVARALLVEAENAGGGVALELGALGGPSPLLSAVLPYLERAGGPIDVVLNEQTAGTADQSLIALWHSPLHRMWDLGTGAVDGMATVAEGMAQRDMKFASYATQADGLESWGVWKGVSRFNLVLSAVDAGDEGFHAYQDSRGEVTVARGFTAVTTAGGDFAVDACPPAALVDLATDGLLHTDVHFLSTISGSGISGGIRGAEAAAQADQADVANNNPLGFAAHIVSGGAVGAWQSADGTWQHDATDLAVHGPLFMRGVSWLVNTGVDKSYGPMNTAVNWAVDHSYTPISNVAGAVAHTTGTATRGAEHLAQHAWHGLVSAV
jgi:hypothetical protein